MSAQHPHHLGRLQAAGMASMFPPNPMFNLHPPTTPPKQSAASQSSRAAGVAGSNPAQYTPTTSGSSHRSATSLARLQQLTNGLENTSRGRGSDPSGASAVPTSRNPTGNSIPGAKPTRGQFQQLLPTIKPSIPWSLVQTSQRHLTTMPTKCTRGTQVYLVIKKRRKRKITYFLHCKFFPHKKCRGSLCRKTYPVKCM